jgi:hypothetical protein
MHAAGERPETVTPDPRPLRTAQLLRAAVLFITGAVIAFTATLHWQVEFDVLMVLGGLTLIGIATLYEYYVYRGTAESWWLAARAIIAFGGAGAPPSRRFGSCVERRPSALLCPHCFLVLHSPHRCCLCVKTLSPSPASSVRTQ